MAIGKQFSGLKCEVMQRCCLLCVSDGSGGADPWSGASAMHPPSSYPHSMLPGAPTQYSHPHQHPTHPYMPPPLTSIRHDNPYDMPGSGLPPMHQFHGGGAPFGAASPPNLNGENLAPTTSQSQTGETLGKALQSVRKFKNIFVKFLVVQVFLQTNISAIRRFFITVTLQYYWVWQLREIQKHWKLSKTWVKCRNNRILSEYYYNFECSSYYKKYFQ